MSLTARHVEVLQASAISLTLAESLGIRSITTTEELREHAYDLSNYDSDGLGILFPWTDETGLTVPQIRLDHELGDMKYAWPTGQTQILGVVRPGLNANSPVLIVEGMKQALAVTSCLPANAPHRVVAMAGCYGTAKVDYSSITDREVIVIFDADLKTKEGVWNAANLVKDQLEMQDCTVRFAQVPGTKDTGIDDVLGRFKSDRGRTNSLIKLLEKASAELPPKPGSRASSSNPSSDDPDNPYANFFDENNKFLPGNAAVYFSRECAIFEKANGMLRRFENGVYVDRTSQKDWDPVIAGITFNAYVVGQSKRVYDNLVAILRERAGGNYPGEFLDEPWLNCKNVMVHLITGEVIDHDSSILSTVQFGTEYDPSATCPVFDQWLLDMAMAQGESLLEHLAQIINPCAPPKKHIVLFGPAGTGKSTLLRIIESVISGTYGGASEYCSAVDMEALNEGGFNTVELAGKLLNAAGELSSKAINDITRFKTLTGDDIVTADKKHHGQVTFRPRALFCFNANAVPQIQDSDPYFRRVTPFRFGNNIGKTDPKQGIEDHIRHHELSGVLNRLIEAWRRTYERGSLLAADVGIVKQFKMATDPVLRWYESEDNTFAEGWHNRTRVYNSYRDFCNETGDSKPTGAGAFYEAIEKIEGVELKARKVNNRTERQVYMPFRVMPEIEEETAEEVESDPAPNDDRGPADAGSVPTIITLDLETTGLDMWSDLASFVRLAGWMRDGDAEVSVSTSPSDIPLDGILVGQNLVNFDMLALHRLGLLDLEDVITGKRLVLDTMLIARHLDPPVARGTNVVDTERPHSLEKLAEKHGFPIEKDTLKKLAIEFNTSEFKHTEKGFTGYGEIPQDNEDYIRYLKDDVIVTRKVLEAEVGMNLAKLADPTFTPNPWSNIGYIRRENKIAAIAALCRNTGIRVDVPELEARLEKQNARRAVLLDGLETNWGLPSVGKAPHLSNAGKDAIYNALTSLGVEAEDFVETKKGNISYGKESMENIIAVYEDNEEIVELAETIMEISGQRSMYQQVWDNLVGDRVHPDIDSKQASGRWSVTKPGLTTVGKRGRNANEREIFLPEPGHLFVSTDFAQVDARCVAALSQDEGYMGMFIDGRDLHTEVAVACFGDPARRQQAKAIGHGVNYGRGAKGIAAREGIDFDVAQQFVSNFFEQFPGILAWQNECRNIADEGGILNNGWGRRLKADPERAYTQAPGLVGQSAARDVMCEALLRVDPEVRRCLRLVIHDEFLWSIPEDKLDEYTAEITRAMTFEWRGVQFLGEPGKPGATWYAAYDK